MGRLKHLSINKLWFAHYQKLLKARQQQRLVENNDFIGYWDQANEEKRKLILKLLKRIRPDAIKKIINDNLTKIPVSELRKEASYYRIKNYSRKSKDQLLTEIMEKRNERRSKSDRKITKRNGNSIGASRSPETSDTHAIRRSQD